MNCRELMLGNIILHKGEPCIVVDIRRKAVRLYHIKRNFKDLTFTNISKCEPVYLTVDLLQDIGFLRAIMSFTYKGEFVIWSDVRFTKFTYNKSIDVSKLHILQNLYYQLTKKDFKIKFL